MTRPLIDSKNNHYTNYKPQHYNSNPIINGYFPSHKTYKEMAITRVNKTLCSILLCFILVSAVSYYFVTASEITLNKYRKQAMALNDENVDLQNRLDYLKSYYNVDRAMQKQHLLQKAKTVIEVKSNNSIPVKSQTLANAAKASKPIQWSIGF